MPHSRKTKHIDDSDLQHSWSSQAAITEAMKSQTCIRRLHILCVFMCIVCALPLYPPQFNPLYSSTVPTVPTGPLHCTYWTPPPYSSTAPFHCTHRTPSTVPTVPTVPTLPLHRTHPIVPFFTNITQPNLHFSQPSFFVQ